MLSDNAFNIYKRLYFANTEKSPTEVHKRVARFAATGERTASDEKYWADKFLELLEQNYFRPNSPVLMNCGLQEKPQTSACFVAGLEDSLVSILDFDREAALIYAGGSGIGAQYGVLREKDAPLSGGGQSSGPISFLKKLEATARCVKSGGRARRAAHLAMMYDWHPDVLDFIELKMKDDYIRSANLSVALSDAFMQAVEKDDVWKLKSVLTGDVKKEISAKEMFLKIAEGACRVGDPGVFFIDRAEADNTTPSLGNYKTTNPCLAGDTWLFDGNRLRRIKESSYKSLFSTYEAWFSGMKPTIKLTLSDGSYLVCTEDHQIECIREDGGFEWVQAKDTLGRYVNKIGDRYIGDDFAISGEDIEGKLLGSMFYLTSFKENVFKIYADRVQPDMAAFLFQKGAFSKKEEADYICISESNMKEILLPEEIKALKKKAIYRFLPEQIVAGKVYTLSSFLRGFFEVYGCVRTKVGEIALPALNKKFANQLQLILSVFGVQSWIEDQDVVIRDGKSLERFKKYIGVSYELKGNYTDKVYPKVKQIEDTKVREVFDFRMFDGKPYNAANGIIVHNCGEQVLHERQSCCLASINLTKFVDGNTFNFNRFREVAGIVTRFLDNLIDISGYPTPDYERVAKETRPIGVGIMGFADLLVDLDIKYSSKKARDLAELIAKTLTESVMEASIELAAERGSFPLFESNRNRVLNVASKFLSKSVYDKLFKIGIRNSQWTTIPPTGSIAISCDCSPGMEPYFAVCFDKKLSDTGDTWSFIVPRFKERFGERPDFKSLLDKIAENGGSVSCLGKEEDESIFLFETAHDISWKDRVAMQASFQKYISNGISSTVNLKKGTTPEEVAQIYMKAWQSGLKGITVYVDGSKERQPIVFGGATSKMLGPQNNGKRGVRLQGETIKVMTGHGSLYVTINRDEDGVIRELFSNGGKGGSVSAADLEAITRVISIALQEGVSLDRIVNTMLNINDGTTCWSKLDGSDEKPVLITSIPDAIAKVLERFGLGRKHDVTCPSCGGPAFLQEGCLTCINCGSKCS